MGVSVPPRQAGGCGVRARLRPANGDPISYSPDDPVQRCKRLPPGTGVAGCGAIVSQQDAMTFGHPPRAALSSSTRHIGFGPLHAIADEAAGVERQSITGQLPTRLTMYRPNSADCTTAMSPRRICRPYTARANRHCPGAASAIFQPGRAIQARSRVLKATQTGTRALFRRHAAATRPRPASIVAQVSGSGMGAVKVSERAYSL